MLSYGVVVTTAVDAHQNLKGARFLRMQSCKMALFGKVLPIFVDLTDLVGIGRILSILSVFSGQSRILKPVDFAGKVFFQNKQGLSFIYQPQENFT